MAEENSPTPQQPQSRVALPYVSVPRNPFELLAPADIKFGAKLARALRANLTPPLLPSDVVGLVMTALTPCLHRKLLTPGHSVRIEELKECERLALGAALAVCGPISAEAGLLPTIAMPSNAFINECVARCDTWWLQWREEMNSITAEAERNLWQPSSDPRADWLFTVWARLHSRNEQDGATLLRDLLVGLEVAKRRPLTADERDGLELAAQWRLIAGGSPELVDLAYFGEDGKFHLGKRQIHDRLKTPERRERQPQPTSLSEPLPRARNSDSEGSEELENSLAAQGASPAEEVEAADEARAARVLTEAVKAAITARLARRSTSKVDRLLRQHIAEILEGRVSLSDLAERWSVSRSRCFERWREIVDDATREVTDR